MASSTTRKSHLKHSIRLLTAAIVAVAVLAPTVALADDEFRLIYFPHEDVTSRFSNDWGDARSGGRQHQGTDIFGTKHSEVLAVADGFVIAIDESPRSGFYVRVAHRDGWESWYLHLNNDTLDSDDGAGGPESAFAPDLEVGMFIAAGTVIGYVGDSGNAEGASSHTHFELHDGTRALNPYPYVADAYSRWIRVMDLADEVR
jgi:murein DD-endopeptidase MepM/ murein hydrolase activator NlpD